MDTDKTYNYTHIVTDGSHNNFKVGTQVFIIGDNPILDLVFISDGEEVKLCYKEQLKLLGVE